MTSRPLRVFLCHSNNDKPAVRELYQKLRAEPWIQPWLDEEELFPGMDWNMEIEKAIEETDVIMVCLSNNSITKEGYVQREIRIALDYADYKPEGTLFIIPVRLEECTPPKRLARWQYVDYFKGQRKRALQRLFVSFEDRLNSLGLGVNLSKPKTANKPSIKPKNKSSQEKSSAIKKQTSILTTPVKTVSKKSPRKKANPDIRESIRRNVEKVLARNKINSAADKNKFTLSNGTEFMRVPAGKFLMGSEKEIILGYGNENPQRTVGISYHYWMARFHITNEQYDVYVKAKGIKHPVDEWEKKKNHPVVFVKWEDAMNYCEWVNDLLRPEIPSGLVLRLPTDVEWEKAARGIDGRKYPWGNIFGKNKCSTEESGKGVTPVGLYSPRGDSPYGCADMAGNVWEWTYSNEKNLEFRFLRGGSFNFDERRARCAYRLKSTISHNNFIGFRVCLAPLPHR